MKQLFVPFVISSLVFLLLFSCENASLKESLSEGGVVVSEVSQQQTVLRNRYIYFKEPVRLNFALTQSSNRPSFAETILQIESNEDKSYTLVFNQLNDSLRQLLFLTPLATTSFIIPDSTALTFRLTVDVTADVLRIEMPDTLFVAGEVGFTVNCGYKFNFLPLTATDSKGKTSLLLTSLTVSQQAESSNHRIWLWIILILVADVLFFAVVHYRRRSHRRSQAVGGADEFVLPTSTKTPLEPLIREQAIYLFGGFQAYSRSGEDISQRFSPLLRELLLLLILHAPQGGISSQRIKELLWFDKSDKSAKNNMFVNLGKLRTMLDLIGDYELSGKNGFWVFTSGNIYIDYFEYVQAKSTTLSEESIKVLSGIIRRGLFLKELDFEWLDAFKAAVSDDVLDLMTAYIQALDLSVRPDEVIQIADCMLLIDPMNELAMSHKCRVYTILGKHSMAKQFYEKFVRDYQDLYNEPFRITFSDIIDARQ